ncbi:hypothetical protein [Kutzneria sp. NPDC052558]|uniref:hypothetical protein n=1 Tax=Kutzneria sp. NPDC052558 TaxID=3364121 RepID=UPI0037CB312E
MSRPESGSHHQWEDVQADPDELAAFVPFRPGDRTSDKGPTSNVGSDVDNRVSATFGDYSEGDSVSARRNLGGILGGAVPAGTSGEIVSMERGLLSDSIIVQFENGYTEQVRPDGIKRDSSWF